MTAPELQDLKARVQKAYLDFQKSSDATGMLLSEWNRLSQQLHREELRAELRRELATEKTEEGKA
jgi:hypothetical protein